MAYTTARKEEFEDRLNRVKERFKERKILRYTTAALVLDPDVNPVQIKNVMNAKTINEPVLRLLERLAGITQPETVK